MNCFPLSGQLTFRFSIDILVVAASYRAVVCFAFAVRKRFRSKMRRLVNSHAFLSTRVQTCGFASTMSLLGKIVPFKLADIGEGILKVEVTDWRVKEGDTVKPYDELCEVESDKAVTTIPSPYHGVIRKLYAPKGGEAFVGKPLVDIEVEGDVPASATEKPAEKAPEAPATPAASAAPTKPAASTPASAPAASTGSKALAVPAVRRIAKENNVDISQIAGTGRDGRVMKEDILAFLEGGRKPTAVGATAGVAADGSAARPAPADRVVELTGVRKAMVKSMTQANSIPAFGASEEIEITKLMQARQDLRKVVEARKKGVKLSFMPFFLKAASLALIEFPELNAHTNADCTQLLVKGSHNIGFAMDTPKGLIVPNVKDCQAKTLFEITEDLNAMIEKGQNGTLGPSDLQGGTFAISNIGSIGATYTKPVINPPQVAIGAIGRAQRVPRFDENDNVVAANIIQVSWSADHRVVDGATMVRFSNLFKAYLESPTLMLLDTR